MKKYIIVSCMVIWSNAFAAQFINAPSLTQENGQAVIRFSVDASTDVEVAIMDAGDRMVRHLAAGVLGGTYAPPAPLQAGLSQALVWDGLDDFGTLVGEQDGLSVRVRLNVRPVFERAIKYGHTSYTYWKSAAGLDLNIPGDTVVNSGGEMLDMDHILFRGPYAPNGLYAKTSWPDIMVAKGNDALYIRNSMNTLLKYDGATGQSVGNVSFAMADGCMPQFGVPILNFHGDRFYMDEGSTNGMVFQYDTLGRPYPFATGVNYVKSDTLNHWGIFQNLGQAGAPDSDYYIMNGAEAPVYLSRIQGGRITRFHMLTFPVEVLGGIRCDLKGNLYAAIRFKTKIPDEVNSRINAADLSAKWSQAWWADEMYGSIAKYTNMEGAPKVAWTHQGFSHMVSQIDFRANCSCNKCKFDVDRFGRVFYPNTFVFAYEAVDNNRNRMFRYNWKEAGVPIGVGHHVEVSDTRLYLADGYNAQVVVFRLEGSAAESLSIPFAVANEKEKQAYLVKQGVSCFPNPCNPSTTIFLKNPFGSVSGTRIVLTDVSGRTVRTLAAGADGHAFWNGSDDHGRPVAAGVYLAVAEMGHSKVWQKIILSR